MIKYLRYLALFGCIFSFRAIATEIINVGILDQAVQLNNEILSPYIDLERLSKIIYSTQERQLSPGITDVQNYYLTDFISSELISAEGEMYHGNVVSEALLRGLSPSNINLIPIPIETPRSSSRFRDFISDIQQLFRSVGPNYNRIKSEYKKYFEHEYQNMSRIIRQNDIKVFNISLSREMGNGFLDNIAIRRFFFLEERKNLLRLIRDNPQTLFIMGSGNSELDLETIRSVYVLKLSNVLIAGALDTKKAQKAAFTNYSEKKVDVLAKGVIDSQITGLIHEGSSFSAPTVGNRVLELMTSGFVSPIASGAELKQAFLESSTLTHVTPGSIQKRVYLGNSHRIVYKDLNTDQLSESGQTHTHRRYIEIPYSLHNLREEFIDAELTQEKEAELTLLFQEKLSETLKQNIFESMSYWSDKGIVVSFRGTATTMTINPNDTFRVLIRNGNVYSLSKESAFLQRLVVNIFELNTANTSNTITLLDKFSCDASFTELINR